MIPLLIGLAIIAGALSILWVVGQVAAMIIGDNRLPPVWSIGLGVMVCLPIAIVLVMAYGIGMSILHP